jgi:hypothetical protein
MEVIGTLKLFKNELKVIFIIDVELQKSVEMTVF